MDKNLTDLVETVNFMKDYMVTKMVTKEDLAEAEQRLEKKMDDFREEVKGEFMGVKNRMGGIDNRIDDESARRTDLENRVRVVLPNLPATPERV